MPAKKRNEWLDAGDSDEENGQGYDSEAAEESKITRDPKRRRLEEQSDDEWAQEEEADEDLYRHTQAKSVQTQLSPVDVSNKTADIETTKLKPGIKPRRIRTPSPEITDIRALSKPSSATNPSKTGVIYISRIPPYMQPSALRSKLEPFGAIGRVFLQPEDPLIYARRKKSGGNKKRSFTDGWVEFLSKKDAKLVAEALNAQIIGGKKGSWYHDDVWNIKYLKGFKWHHLTDQIANETAERAARLRTEVAHAARENKRFVEGVEMAKRLETTEKREKERVGIRDTEASEKKRKRQPFRSEFKQNEVISKSKTSREGGKPDADAQSVLSRIF